MQVNFFTQLKMTIQRNKLGIKENSKEDRSRKNTTDNNFYPKFNDDCFNNFD